MNATTPLLNSLQADTLNGIQWARRLNVSPATITRWTLQGELDHVKVGRQIRVTPAAMEKFLQTRTESRQRRHRERQAGDTAKRAAHTAEVQQGLDAI